MLEGLPVWAQFGIEGILTGLIVLVIVLIFKGELVPRKTVEHQQQMIDAYREAWETSEATKQGQAEALNKLVPMGEAQLTILNALKDAWGGSDVVD